jgi:ABC-2 type transport system permease protein
MKSLLKLTWMEAKLFLREPVGTFFTLGFPLMLLFIFGTIFGNKPSEYFNGYGSVDVSIPAYTAMIIATTGLTGLTITMSSYREQGILRRLRTTPISPLYILIAQLVVLFLMTTLGMIMLVIAAKFIYNMRFDGNVLSVLGGFTLSSLSFFAIGFILAGLMPTARTAMIVAMALLYPMLFLCGAGYPLELLPESIHKINKFLPLTYVVKLLRGLWIGESWSLHATEALVLVGIMLVGVLISVKTFRWE